MGETNNLELKEFEKFLKICRKYGVLDVKFDEIQVKLIEKHEMRAVSETVDIETEELTPEQLMYYHLSNPAQ